MTIPQGLSQGPIYLDYNATTPIDPRVAEACWPYPAEHFGNPSSSHHYGRSAHAAVDTVLVSIMHANNETGTIQPIADLASHAHRRGALFHTDASQTTGKIGVSIQELGVDLLTVTGHKMYAPKGIGALYLRHELALEPAIYGSGHERGLRAGAENVALITALGHAAQLTYDNRESEEARLKQQRDLLHDQLNQHIPGRVHLNVSIDSARGDQLLAATPGLAASTGSACHKGETPTVHRAHRDGRHTRASPLRTPAHPRTPDQHPRHRPSHHAARQRGHHPALSIR